MRRKQRASQDTAALTLLREASTYHLATVDEALGPVLRTLNGVLVDDWILFHGALVGEKARAMGRPAVVSAYDQVALIPSYFVDKERACPATTYYRSAQTKGVLEDVTDDTLKALMLQSLMEKYQPEGGHRPLEAQSGYYAKDLSSVKVFGLRMEELTGKESLGQDRPPERTSKVVEGLWNRGEPGDFRAISMILERSPRARPPFLSVPFRPDFLRVQVHPVPELAASHACLLKGSYWREGCSQGLIERSIHRSSAWVGLSDSDGMLCAAARATSDEAWSASLSDVIVRPSLRGQGLGTAVLRLILEHPWVRRARFVRLGTRDAMEFYGKFGFQLGPGPSSSQGMHAMTRLQNDGSLGQAHAPATTS